MEQTLPIIDVRPLLEDNEADWQIVADAIGNACREFGFFYVKGHGVDEDLQNQLEALSHQFFRLEMQEKLQIEMAKGGSAWRGYFSVGEELTSNIPDQKEGIYFGTELSNQHPLVVGKTPMHGPNLFPLKPDGFKKVVLDYMDAVTKLGHALMKGLSLSLGLPAAYFDENYTRDPLILFRIFHYPAVEFTSENAHLWGVGEHTDYGVLTILKQDEIGGLQVKSNHEWIEAPPIPNTFICNIGDMLERMTKGLYISTPHRVKNTSQKSRLSFPLFFDPNYFSEVLPLPIEAQLDLGQQKRWDNANVHEYKGTYGHYLLQKVSKVFPQLVGKI
jgi:isopenicillin N synthase-like dioxygenase